LNFVWYDFGIYFGRTLPVAICMATGARSHKICVLTPEDGFCCV
jgi:hypothetical protein